MNHLPTRPPVVTAQSEPKHTGPVVRASHRALASLVLLFAFAMGSSAVAQGGGNLIQDGGFEGFGIAPGTASYQSSYGAWSTVQGTVALLGTPYGGVPVYEGAAAMHVGDNYGSGYVEQTFATTIGANYKLSFAVVDYQGGATSVQATVSGAGGTDLSANCAAPGGNVWLKHELSFVASSSSSVLRIQNVSGAATIDDVHCTVNLIQDGGFEVGILGPHTTAPAASYGAWTADPIFTALLGLPFYGSGSIVTMQPYEGDYAMVIGGLSAAGFVQQSFPTQVGSCYTISFAVLGWNTGNSNATITVLGSGGVDLSSNFTPAQGNVWTPITFTFTASSANTVLRLGGISGAPIIDDVTCHLCASGGGQPEIELSFTTDTSYQWNDYGCGISGEFHFWRPVVPASAPDFRRFGGIGRFGPTYPVSGMVIGKDLSGSALAAPLSYQQIWNDQTTNCVDVSFWQPIAPPGYVSLGHVCTVYNTYPQPEEAMCVRADLCVLGSIGDVIYYGNAGGSYNLGTWDVVAPAGGIDVGCYVASNSGVPPSPVYCLKASAVAQLAPPTQAQLTSMIQTYGPVIRMHPNEAAMPDDPAALLDDAQTSLVESLLVNPGVYGSFFETTLNTVPTASSTILDDVQASLAAPIANNPGFLSRLEFPMHMPGDLSRAEAYVRVQPLDGALTEIQFWIFYPWNGPGRAYASATGGAWSATYNPTGTVGQHHADWENVRIRMAKDLNNPGQYVLVNVVMSRHDHEEVIEASDPRLSFAQTRPVIYSAERSHAHYPGAGYYTYKTVFEQILGGIATIRVDAKDLTGNGPLMLAYQDYRIVSSAWPSIVTDTPDWFYFGGQWGGFSVYPDNSFTPPPASFYSYQADTITEVGNGKPGMLRRNEFAVPLPINANLGRLFTDAGAVSPAFVPQGANYEMTVPNGTSTIALTALAEDHNAVVVIDCNGTSYPVASGHLYGLATSIPLVQGLNTCQVTVTVAGATRTYDLDITREFEVLPHSCGPVTIETSAASSARLGGHIETTISNYTGGIPLIGLGFLPSVPFCGCTIGHNWIVITVTDNYTLAIPNDPSLNGFQVAIQGDGFLTPGGCASPMLSLSDTILVTLGQ